MTKARTPSTAQSEGWEVIRIQDLESQAGAEKFEPEYQKALAAYRERGPMLFLTREQVDKVQHRFPLKPGEAELHRAIERVDGRIEFATNVHTYGAALEVPADLLALDVYFWSEKVGKRFKSEGWQDAGWLEGDADDRQVLGKAWGEWLVKQFEQAENLKLDELSRK